MTLDANADGALGTAEVTTALSALDTNGDGQLSRDEQAAARSTDGTATGAEALLGGGWRGGHAGGPGHGDDRPAPEPVVIGDAVTAIFDACDSDDSGTIAVSELLAALGSHGRGGDAESRVTAAVARIDTDADGALSAAELTAALTAADTNQDGSVGPGELGPGSDVGLVGVLLHHLDVPDVA
jgi:Ca2+-binding EF-hand superfamily protein